MILKEQNNQKKTLTDGVLAVNHEQENTPSTNGKASPLAWPFPAWPAPGVAFPRVACPAQPAPRVLSPRGLPRPACPAWPFPAWPSPPGLPCVACPARPPAGRARGCREGCPHGVGPVPSADAELGVASARFPEVPRLSPRLPNKVVYSALPQQRSSDGSLSHEEDLAKVIELQEVIDKQAREQSQMKERLAALSSHVTELEEDLDTARKDLIKSEEVNTKLQRDVREVSERRNRSSVVGLTGVCRFDCFVPFVPNSPSCSQLLGYCLSDSRTGWRWEPGGHLPVLWSSLLSRGASGSRMGMRPPPATCRVTA